MLFSGKKVFFAVATFCFLMFVACTLTSFFSKTPREEPPVKITRSISSSTSSGDSLWTVRDVEKSLRKVLSSRSFRIQKRWTNDSVKSVAYILHQHGYIESGIDHPTSLAMILHESGFNIDKVTPNYSSNGRVKSYDYFLTQQNSLVVRSRYYSLKSYIGNREKDPWIRGTLLKRMSGKFEIEKIRDPVVNVALMFQTFRECKQHLRGKTKTLSRMVLCYNSPRYARRVKKSAGKTAYVKEVMTKRRQIVKLL